MCPQIKIHGVTLDVIKSYEKGQGFTVHLVTWYFYVMWYTYKVYLKAISHHNGSRFMKPRNAFPVFQCITIRKLRWIMRVLKNARSLWTYFSHKLWLPYTYNWETWTSCYSKDRAGGVHLCDDLFKQSITEKLCPFPGSSTRIEGTEQWTQGLLDPKGSCLAPAELSS